MYTNYFYSFTLFITPKYKCFCGSLFLIFQFNENEVKEETTLPQVIIDAFTLLEGSLFVIDINGQLVEHARSERLWINHGLPSNDVPLSFARGVVLRDKHPTRVGK